MAGMLLTGRRTASKEEVDKDMEAHVRSCRSQRP